MIVDKWGFNVFCPWPWCIGGIFFLHGRKQADSGGPEGDRGRRHCRDVAEEPHVPRRYVRKGRRNA